MVRSQAFLKNSDYLQAIVAAKGRRTTCIRRRGAHLSLPFHHTNDLAAIGETPVKIDIHKRGRYLVRGFNSLENYIYNIVCGLTHLK